MRTLFAPMFIPLLLICQSLSGQAIHKHRAIILTDIEADPDDTESMVRLLTYSNVIDLKGLIATTSLHQRNNVHPESIRKAIRAYGEVQANLMEHETGFPDADSLLLLVKQGLLEYGMKGAGGGKNSPGSDWIIKVLEENDQRPLWVCVWGGANTLAQALYEIRRTRTEPEARILIARLRVYLETEEQS